jgi:hypothetical protein
MVSIAVTRHSPCQLKQRPHQLPDYKETTMQTNLKISVRRVLPLTDREDAHAPGTYLVQFAESVKGLPQPKLASIALDVFHSNVSIGCLDDFEINVVDELDRTVQQDADHDDYSGSDDGTVEQINDSPRYLPHLDVESTVEDLQNRYNPDGDGEHPLFTQLEWRLEVVLNETLEGYWAWVKAEIDKRIAGEISPFGRVMSSTASSGSAK